MKRGLRRMFRDERGVALPAVLAMLALGSLLLVPSLSYASTHLMVTRMVKNDFKALYAADAGIEDGLWKLKYDQPESFPYSYQLTDIDGMNVDVLIEPVETIAGEEIGESGVHEGWLKISKTVTYEGDGYSYILSILNNGGGNMWIQTMLIILPPGVDYDDYSTSGNVTFDEPDVVGDPASGITVVWVIPSPYKLGPGGTVNQAFFLTGDPDIEGVEGHSLVEATREDVGTVWDADSHPYAITAVARDAQNEPLCTIRAGVWEGVRLEISCWQINQT